MENSLTAQPPDPILPLVYDELHRIAAVYMRRERSNHTLQPTALVHEAYLRLVGQHHVDWRNRAHVIGLAAVMMRRILVTHARQRAAAKRGSEQSRVSLTVAAEELSAGEVDVLDLHEALERLTAIDERQGRIVELKFFGGLTTAQIADVMKLSNATIEREWALARAWLADALGHAT
jgi:RNA polymerase sigma factor (TIGR02999 family)